MQVGGPVAAPLNLPPGASAEDFQKAALLVASLSYGTNSKMTRAATEMTASDPEPGVPMFLNRPPWAKDSSNKTSDHDSSRNWSIKVNIEELLAARWSSNSNNDCVAVVVEGE